MDFNFFFKFYRFLGEFFLLYALAIFIFHEAGLVLYLVNSAPHYIDFIEAPKSVPHISVRKPQNELK